MQAGIGVAHTDRIRKTRTAEQKADLFSMNNLVTLKLPNKSSASENEYNAITKHGKEFMVVGVINDPQPHQVKQKVLLFSLQSEEVIGPFPGDYFERY